MLVFQTLILSLNVWWDPYTADFFVLSVPVKEFRKSVNIIGEDISNSLMSCMRQHKYTVPIAFICAIFNKILQL